ncbi:hypothetical protein CL689_04300 [Candidatus Saccharibacteria bacterium]|nr:hypothetical protein [Candidatus Saccharibacteria bacterium]MBJ58419.1 hypothetical protein [Candidatus Saccharibacteria bacterium]MBQ69265.1 hypothetical protein [Candidatus Saccharibacteria bacterium]|tara:strand:+ start:52 stop:693 length:642 start_codon:yes stop_codon:yes gene_type:complete
MKITAISVQARDKNRVNVSVDGRYRFSLDMAQLVELGIRVGNEYDEAELVALETESQFGKLYMRALEYCFSRPHSRFEVKQYLYRKTRPRRTKTGELRPGVPVELTERVYGRLDEKGHLDDEAFARYWVENRRLKKGASMRKLYSELAAKGVSREIIDQALEGTERDDKSELKKVVAKRAGRYDDPQKLIAYLARQGFSYDDIKQALSDRGEA